MTHTLYIHSQAVYELPFGPTPTVFSEASIDESLKNAQAVITNRSLLITHGTNGLFLVFTAV